MCRDSLDRCVKTYPVIAHRQFYLRIAMGQADPDVAGLGVLADVGDGFLHQPVHHQLGRGLEWHSLQCAMNLNARSFSKFTGHDLQRRQQAQIAQGRRAQVFNDAPAQRDAAVEVVHQVNQQFGRLGRGVAQTRLDARGVQLGRCQQRAQVIVQVARQAAAFVFTRGLQVVGQLGEQSSTLNDLGLQPVALVQHHALLFQQQHLVGKPLAQVHEQRQQAHSGQQRHANAAQHQHVINVLSAFDDPVGFQLEQIGGQQAEAIQMLLADAAHDDLHHGRNFALIVQAEGHRQF